MMITIYILSSVIVTAFALSAIFSRRITNLSKQYFKAGLIYKEIDQTYKEFRELVQNCPKIYTEDDLTKANTILANRIKMYEDDVKWLNVKRDEHRNMVDKLIAELEESKADIDRHRGSYEDLYRQVIDVRDDTINHLRRTDATLGTLLSIIRVDIKK